MVVMLENFDQSEFYLYVLELEEKLIAPCERALRSAHLTDVIILVIFLLCGSKYKTQFKK